MISIFTSVRPLSEAFLALLDTFGFTQFAHESSPYTLDLILSHRKDLQGRNVFPVR